MKAGALTLAFCALAGAAVALAAAQETAIVVEVETPVTLEGQPIRGSVLSRAQLDSVLVSWTDGFGNVFFATTVDTQAGLAAPFYLPATAPVTPINFIRASGSAGSADAAFTVIPREDGFWNRFVIAASAPPESAAATAGFSRALGMEAALTRGAQECVNAGRGGLRPIPVGLISAGMLSMTQQDFNTALSGYLTEGKTEALKRFFSLSNRGETMRVARDAGRQTRVLRRFAPPGFVVADNVSVTRGNAVLDVSFDAADLAGFAVFASDRIGSAAELSARWGPDVSSLEDIAPLTARDMKGRVALRSDRPLDIAPWALHREYMDGRLAAVIVDLSRTAQRQSRTGEADDFNWSLFQSRFGFSGAQAPSAYGGYDWTMLSGVCDFVILDREAPQWAWGLVRDLAAARVLARIDGTAAGAPAALWRAVFEGLGGVVIDNADKMLARLAATAAEGAAQQAPPAGSLAESLVEIQGLADILSVAEKSASVAVLYSPASVRAGWMLDYLQRDGLDESGPAAGTEALEAWSRILSDLGVDHKWVSERRVAMGELLRAGFAAVILPEAYSLAPETVAALVDYASAGGYVLADNGAGLLDGTYLSYARSPADALFAIRRAVLTGEKAAMLSLRRGESASGIPVADTSVEISRRGAAAPEDATGTRNPVGAGGAVYLNLLLRGYPAGAEPLKQAIRDAVSNALGIGGITPRLQAARENSLFSAPVRIYALPATSLVLLDPGPARAAEGDAPVRLRLPQGFNVYNLRPSAPEGEPFGATPLVSLRPSASGPLAIALTDLTLAGLSVEVDFDGAALYVRAALESREPPGRRLFRIEVYGPTGSAVAQLGRTVAAENGTCLSAIPVPLNAPPGVWRLLVRDLASGMASWVDVAVQ
ncbi:MAG: hypothetical protein ACYTAN_03460 [Planctomycetota bacterium]|jgi:hypothetical protein